MSPGEGASPDLATVARDLLLPIYVPWIGMSLCLGMVSVALPLYLTEVGMGYLPLSAVLTGAGVGSMLGGVPVGDAVARIGERAMLAAGIVALFLTTVALAASDDFVVLALWTSPPRSAARSVLFRGMWSPACLRWRWSPSS